MNDEMMPETSAGQREAYIPFAVKHLLRAIDTQAKYRDDLLARLTPVLNRDAAPHGEPSQEATGIPLADDISGAANQIDVTNSVFEDILSRLEI
ncbi:MAG: hypothetical protein ACYSW6_10130 [Planctomycetota bacterium]|jgi:hypothetical protein